MDKYIIEKYSLIDGEHIIYECNANLKFKDSQIEKALEKTTLPEPVKNEIKDITKEMESRRAEIEALRAERMKEIEARRAEIQKEMESRRVKFDRTTCKET